MTTQQISTIAEAAHEANRIYCRSLGDYSQKPWGRAAQGQRDSLITGVLNVINNPDTTPEKSHESWLAEKTRTGWIYGPVKDHRKKMHPCFRPYTELPPEQRAKDALFLAVVRTLLAGHGVVMPQPQPAACPERRRDPLADEDADD
jgi:hypothetical protein